MTSKRHLLHALDHHMGTISHMPLVNQRSCSVMHAVCLLLMCDVLFCAVLLGLKKHSQEMSMRAIVLYLSSYMQAYVRVVCGQKQRERAIQTFERMQCCYKFERHDMLKNLNDKDNSCMHDAYMCATVLHCHVLVLQIFETRGEMATHVPDTEPYVQYIHSNIRACIHITYPHVYRYTTTECSYVHANMYRLYACTCTYVLVVAMHMCCARDAHTQTYMHACTYIL